MGSLTPLQDRIDARRDGKVIELRRQPRWLERRMAERRGESPWVAVKDTSEWRPEPAA
jgi:hypothetical protein